MPCRDHSPEIEASRGGSLVLRVPGTLEGVDRAVDEARRFYSPPAGASGLFGLLTAVREALLNAACHGCGLDPGLTVECVLGRDGRDAVITVRDPGAGFDRASCPGQIPPCRETSGRGRKMMDIFSKSLTYNEQGNELTLRIEIDREDGS